MEWILLCIGAVVLIVATAFFVIMRISQQNVKDKGGMENPNSSRATPPIEDNNTESTTSE